MPFARSTAGVTGCVRNRLAAMLEKSADGAYAETDEGVRKAAAQLVASIDSSRSFYSGFETLFFGLSLGSVLVLIAIGLAITFGVMGVINMAHGELMMIGAYTVYVVQLLMPNHIGASILVAIPAAFLVAGAGRRPARAHDHPISLRPSARDAARDLWRQPGAAAAGPVDSSRRTTAPWKRRRG